MFMIMGPGLTDLPSREEKNIKDISKGCSTLIPICATVGE